MQQALCEPVVSFPAASLSPGQALAGGENMSTVENGTVISTAAASTVVRVMGFLIFVFLFLGDQQKFKRIQ